MIPGMAAGPKTTFGGTGGPHCSPLSTSTRKFQKKKNTSTRKRSAIDIHEDEVRQRFHLTFYLHHDMWNLCRNLKFMTFC